MATQHEFLDNLITGRTKSPPVDKIEQLRLENEIRAVQKAMLVLPTARESDALPELQHLLSISHSLVAHREPGLNTLIVSDENIRVLIVTELFEHVCKAVIKARIYNNKEIIKVADQLFCNLVTWATRLIRHDFREVMDLLNTIIDKSADYYKTNGKEASFMYPFGEQLKVEDDHKEWVDALKEGDSVDCLKNYGGKRIWSKGVIITSEYNLLKVRYVNDTYEAYMQNKYFELAKPGTRVSDFEWRQSLAVGDEVDFYNLRQDWVRYKIVEVLSDVNTHGEEVRSLKLAKYDVEVAEYDALTSAKAQAPAIAQSGRFSSRGGGVDDSEDDIFLAMVGKPKYAIMRTSSMYSSSSIYIIKYINLFGEEGGFEYLLEILSGEKQTTQDILGLHVRIIQSSSDYLIEPFIRTNGKKLMKSIRRYVLSSSEKNLRDLSQTNLNAILEGVSCLAQRVYPTEKARKVADELKLNIALICLNSEFLEKQFFGAKIVAGIEQKLRSRESEICKTELAKRIAEAGVFEKVVKGHSSLVAKSSGILNILFSESAISENQLDFLWNEIGKTDIDSRNALLGALKEVLWNFSKEEVRYFVKAIKKKCEALNNAEVFELLFALKRVAWNRHNDTEVVNIVNEVLWQVLKSQKVLKEDLKKEVIKNFIKFLQEDTGDGNYTTRMLDAVLERENLEINLKILGKILKLENSLSMGLLDQIEERRVIQTILNDVIQRLDTGSRAGKFERELKFIEIAMRLGENRSLVDFADVEKLWKIVYDKNLEIEAVLRWIKGYIIRDHDIGILSELQRFFDTYVEGLLQPNKANFLQFFMLLFFKINILEGKILKQKLKLETMGMCGAKQKIKHFYVLNVPVKELSCFERIWSVFERTNEEALERQMANFITKVYFKPEFSLQIDPQLYSQELSNIYNKCLEMYTGDDTNQIRKASVLLDKLMKREEAHNFGPLRSLASLKEGEKVVLDIEKNTKYFKERFRATFTTNSTLAEIRERISKEYRLAFGIIEIHVNSTDGRELTSLENSSTIEELGLKMRDLILVDEKEIPETQEHPLLDETGKMFTNRAILVFKEVFATYSKDRKMGRQDLANFTTAATEGTLCTVHDARIETLFKKYDSEKKGYIEFDNFIDFYLESASMSEHKANTVRDNLLSLGYGKDLRLKSEGMVDNWTQSIRLALAKNEDFSKVFMQRLAAKDLSVLESSFHLFMTPPISYIQRIVQNPLNELSACVNEPALLEYFTTLIDAIVFHKDLFANFDDAVGLGDLDLCARKVFTLEFIKEMLKHVSSQFSSNLVLRFVEKWFRILTESKKEGFVKNTTNFLAYFVLQKKKQEAITVSETKETAVQTEKNVYGPANKSGKKDKEEEETVNEEESNLLLTLMVLDKQKLDDLRTALHLQDMNNKLIDIIIDVSQNQDELSTFRKNRLRSSIVTLLASLMLDTEQLDHLFADPNARFKYLLILGLSHKKALARMHFKNFYAYLTSAVTELKHKTVFLKLLIESLKKEDIEEVHILLELASNLLAEISEVRQKAENNTELHSEFNFGALFSEFGHRLENTTSKEENYDSKEDSSLSAILIFMEKLLRADPLILSEMPTNERQRIANYIFKKCLFDVSANTIDFRTVKCKSQRSRGAALDLLRELCIGDNKTQMNILITGFGPLSHHIPDFTTIGTSSSLDRKSSYGFLGIRNPGCTCYMNAMLQQFYCTPAFRYAMLVADDHEEIQSLKISDNYSIDDNVFHQLQRMFSYLDRSERHAYNPVEFCTSYKDFTGERVNVMVQQDAQEFLNVIFEKIEKAIKPTPYIGMLNSVFSGKTCNVFTCKGCGFVRSNEEMFYNLSLEVKNLDNLKDSFDRFISQETISDFMCDNCKRKCDVTKQCFLKKLPNVLIIHLQKIIFDVESLMNIKIASKFEFGHNMNLQKYVYAEEQGGVDVEEFEYKLVGVVIHRGNAEFGHYTSLINVNRKDPSRNFADDTWLEFDDSRINKFNMDNFDEECFGSDERDYGNSLLGVDAQMSKNAYILIYDKVRKGKLTFTVTEENKGELEKIKANLINKDDFVQNGETCETDFYNLGPFVPSVYADEIERDNNVLLLEQQVLSAKFCNTFADIIGSSNLPLASMNFDPTTAPDKYQTTLSDLYLKTLPMYLFRIFCASNENYRVGKLVKAIENSLVLHKDKSLRFFGENVCNNLHYLLNLLINSSDVLVRTAVADFIVFSITIMIKHLDLSLDVDMQYDYQTVDDSLKPGIYLQNVIDKFLAYIPPADPSSSSYRKLSAYFYTLHKLMENNRTIAEYAFKSDVLKSLYELYLCHEPNRISSHEKALTSVLSSIAVLLKLQKSLEEESEHAEPQFHQYVASEFLAKIMKEDYRFNNYEALKELVDITVTDNYLVSQEFAYVALKGLSMAPDTEAVSYLEGLKALLNVKDSYSSKRLALVLGYPKLQDCRSRADEGGYYLYGLAKENSLKKVVYGFPSTFGQERGMLDELSRIRDLNESCALLIIFYLLDIATDNPDVMDYLFELPPATYLSNSAVDWFRSYAKTQLDSFQHSYNAPKAELMYLYFNHLDEKLKKFEEVALSKLPAGSVIFGSSAEPLTYSKHTNYIIGKTLSGKELTQITLTDELSLTVTLVRVSLRETKANGEQNTALPDSVISYDHYINKTSIANPDVEHFLGISNSAQLENDADDRLKSLMDDDEHDEPQVNTKLVRKFSDRIPDTQFFLNSDYILRISLDNQSDSNFFCKVLIEGNESVRGDEILVPVRLKKNDICVQNLWKKDLQGSFSGVKIWVKICEVDSLNFKYYAEEDLGEYSEVYSVE